MYYQAKLEPARTDGLTTIKVAFGSPPAQNDLVVPDAIRSIEALELKGGPGVLFNGPISVPVAMALAHSVAHLYQFVACFDPKMGKFVVVISHTDERRPGDLLK